MVTDGDDGDYDDDGDDDDGTDASHLSSPTGEKCGTSRSTGARNFAGVNWGPTYSQLFQMQTWIHKIINVYVIVILENQLV